MVKKVVCVCWLFLSVIMLIGCGSNTQTSSQSNVMSNDSVKTNESQAKTYDGWTTVKVDGGIEFQIPPTMEIQSEGYQNIIKQIKPNYYQIQTEDGKLQRIVAQQKGLNNYEEQARKRYVRAILKFTKSPQKAFPQWGEDLQQYMTADDLKSLDESFYSMELPEPNMKFVKLVQNSKIIQVNDISCINTKYETQLGDNPVVINDMYIFFNENRRYIFLTMIRSTEYEYWTAKDVNVQNIIKTIKII
ncbi:MAG: hypothetical protein J6Z82_00975 [Schwartzia sp.]|nr:hypothetical protein [Schwartzia sp. (in: firmicutes)]